MKFTQRHLPTFSKMFATLANILPPFGKFRHQQQDIQLDPHLEALKREDAAHQLRAARRRFYRKLRPFGARMNTSIPMMDADNLGYWRQKGHVHPKSKKLAQEMCFIA